MLEGDPEESYTAIRSVVTVPTAAAQEARENPRVDELRERLVKDSPRLFSGVANKHPPDSGRFGTARVKLKPNPKVYRHQEYQLQGEQVEAMKKLLKEFIERGWIEPSDSEWASPAFIVPIKEKGEWRLVVDYRGLNKLTEHDSYSLPLIDTPHAKTGPKAHLHGVRPQTWLSPDAAAWGLQGVYGDEYATQPHAMESGADGSQ